MAGPATVADVESRWRPLTDDETTLAETRLEDVYRNIRRRFRKLGKNVDALIAADDALSDGDVDKGFREDVIEVQADAVIRVLINPEKLRMESIDDYSRTRDKSVSDGVLRVTGEEWAKLGVTSESSSRAFSIDTTPAAALDRSHNFGCRW
jgi:hypothetical protein